MNRRQFLELASVAIALGAIGSAGVRALDDAPDDGIGAAEWHRARRFAATPFGDVAYIERGAGPAALFLHGFPLNGYQWRGALARLAPYRRCIAPDFLGLGYTEVAEGQSVDPDAQVAMLVALLDTLGIDSVDVVANDSGGAVAQLLLVRYPNRVRTLLLTNCDTEFDSPPPALQPVIDLSKQGRFVDQWLAPWHADKTLARSAEGIGGMCYADAAHPVDAAIDMYFAPLIATPRRKALVHAYAMALERNALAGIGAGLACARAPVRILWGVDDTIFARESPDVLDRAFGNSRGVRRIAGAKLFWPEERPDLIAGEAQRLWNAWAPTTAI